MAELVTALPLILAAIVPPVFGAIRAFLGEAIPDKWIPVILPIGGGIVAALAHLVGVDASILASVSRDPQVWETVVQGVVVGSAGVGVHQIKAQRNKPPG